MSQVPHLYVYVKMWYVRLRTTSMPTTCFAEHELPHLLLV